MQPDMTKKFVYFSLICIALLLSACVTNGPANKVWSNDKRVRAQVELGLDYLKRDQLDIARERFEKALSINKSSSAALHGLGLVEAKSLNYDRARQYLSRSIQLSPDNEKAKSDYAVILCETQSASQGIELLEGMRTLTLSLGAQLALARCYEANHELNKAEKAYQVVLSSRPTTRQALISMAHLKYQADNYLSARGFLQRYFATNTISSKALLLAAKVENNLQNLEERDRYTKQLWARYPKTKHATEARELFSR